MSKWAPPNEKGKFVAALLGGNLGTVFIFQISGVIIETVGWPITFYSTAIICGVITLLWAVLVADTPKSHSRISNSELRYIEESLGGNVSTKKVI